MIVLHDRSTNFVVKSRLHFFALIQLAIIKGNVKFPDLSLYYFTQTFWTPPTGFNVLGQDVGEINVAFIQQLSVGNNSLHCSTDIKLIFVFQYFKCTVNETRRVG